MEEQRLRGFNAAIVQHEIDHLDGILFTDKLTKDPI
jgi:peptide deformylase